MFGLLCQCYCERTDAPIVEQVEVVGSRARVEQHAVFDAHLLHFHHGAHISEALQMPKELTGEATDLETPHMGTDQSCSISTASTVADGEPKEPTHIVGKVTEESFTFGAHIDCSREESFGGKIHFQEPELEAEIDNLPLDLFVRTRPFTVSLGHESQHIGACVYEMPAQQEMCLITSLSGEGALGHWNTSCPHKQRIRTGDRILKVNDTGTDDAYAYDVACRLSEQLSRKEDLKLYVQHPRRTSLFLRNLSEPLGIELVLDSPLGLRISEVKDGLLRRWNTSNPLLALQPGDRIIAVNGLREPADELIKALQNFTEDICLDILAWPKEFGEFRDPGNHTIFWRDGLEPAHQDIGIKL
eukprot:TRINITY_DN110033_c0_g1_i1.p1 TRINITY_DN110033_c0_g1~~TRINITY_DN110033_c0_g1_i1.p1  ORF type:complete len:367 (-),score=51.78 TRINITY_DN110033_c0_g1_i1:36-1109(-)